MSIEFESDKEKIQRKNTQKEERILTEKQGKKPEKIEFKRPKKTVAQRLCAILLPLSVLGLIYAITFNFAGIISFIPIAILWLFWLLLVIISTVFTLGIVWASEKWRTFIDGVIAFNNTVSASSVAVIKFLQSSFAYFTAGFAICMLSYLITIIIQYKKHKCEKGYKAKLIWTIVMVVFFTLFIIIDTIALRNI